MFLPAIGRIVAVDNEYSEVQPLLTALNKNGATCIHYNGEPENLPSCPLKGIRLLFLDIVLMGMESAQTKTKVSKLIGVYRRIISKDNGPLIIIFWTAHSEVCPNFISACKRIGMKPTLSCCISKQDCIDPATGQMDVALLETKLAESIKEFKSFALFMAWENAVFEATNEFSNDFHLLANEYHDWSKAISNLFFRLYKAHAGKNEVKEGEIFPHACMLLNKSFLCEIEKKTRRIRIPDEYSFVQTLRRSAEGEITSKLNSFLELEIDTSAPLHSGQVYKIDSKSKRAKNLKSSIATTIFKTPPKSRLCKVVITPSCDIACKKTLQDADDESILHRVIYGLLVKAKDYSEGSFKHSDGVYKVMHIWLDNCVYHMFLHFATINSEYTKNDVLIFSLKTELLFDLQSKAANHVNRLGNCLLSPQK